MDRRAWRSAVSGTPLGHDDRTSDLRLSIAGVREKTALLAGGRYHATPLYDILSAHPIIGTKRAQLAPQRARLAMGVKGASGLHYRIGEIRRRHWYTHAR